MISTASFIQRFAAGLSARAASAFVVAPATPAFAGANPRSGDSGSGNSGSGKSIFGHMNTVWLGGCAETGCVQTTYVTKRITTGSLFEVST